MVSISDGAGGGATVLRGRSLWYLGDDRQLLGHHGLELGGVHAVSVVGSLVELRDQRVDGQLQI